MNRTRRAVVLTGGPDYAHDFAATGPELVSIAEEAGFVPVLVDHPDALIPLLTDASVADVLVVNALRWRMLADRHAEWRDEWAYATSPALSRAIIDFVAGGGGLVGNHTAPICFDDWTEWGEVMGGAWDWERSSHPPLGPVSATIVADHPVTAGVNSPVELDDEVYGDLSLRPEITVLATARRNGDDDEQPVVWTHGFGRGRVAYCCFGHDRRSLQHVGVRRILRQAMMWTTRSSTSESSTGESSAVPGVSEEETM
ncbi:MAG: ThuA domain-containing protein [Ilumatobacteraceae bacterium]